MQSGPHTHAPGGANIRASSCPKVPGAVIAVASVRPFLPGHCCRNLGYVASVGPFLPGHCCLGRQRCFSICNSCTKRPFCLFEYFVLPKALTPYFFHRRKLQNYRTHAFLDMGAFACILYHVSTTDFRDPPLTICRMAKSTEKRQKVGLFQRFFHPSMSDFPRFPTFPALSNFYSRGNPTRENRRTLC